MCAVCYGCRVEKSAIVYMCVSVLTPCNLQVQSTCWRATLHELHPTVQHNNVMCYLSCRSSERIIKS